MAEGKIVASGQPPIGLPSWGRCFWQDPNDGVLFLAYASGAYEVNFVTSADSGVTWSAPKLAFYIDDFSVHNNFDIAMDRNGALHAGFRYQNFNCYAHLVKAGSTWNTQAPRQRPWSVCADSGSVGGHNGSVYVNEVADFFFGSPEFQFGGFRATPEIYVVAKTEKIGGGLTAIRAARVTSPYTSAPASGFYSNDVSDAIATGLPPGLDGGFPLITHAGMLQDFFGFAFNYQRQVVYNVDNTGLLVAYNNNSTTAWTFRRDMGLFVEGDPTGGTAQSGLRADVVFGPSMGFEKGPKPQDPLNAILVSTYKKELGSFLDKQWDLFTTCHEHAIKNTDEVDQFVRVDSSVDYKPFKTNQRSENYDEWAQEVSTGGIPPNVAPARHPNIGTLCDITNGANSGVMYLYFNSRNSDGRHCVARLLCEASHPTQSATAIDTADKTVTRYTFSSRFHAVSGIRNFAIADAKLAGGGSGKAFWQNMRALHHVNGQWAAGKSDMVVTVGSGLEPRRNNLVVWDFFKSTEGSAPLRIPTYGFDYIVSSGDGSTTLLGVDRATIAVSPGNLVNLFDQDTTTSATISNGDSVTFEFATPVIITRIEIPWFKNTGLGTGTARDFFEVTVETSIDGTSWETVKTYSSAGGRVSSSNNVNLLVKLTSEYDGSDDSSESYAFPSRMDAGVGKFLRVSFGGPQTGTRNVRELRIYGAGTTAGKTSTNFNNWGRTLKRTQFPSSYVERFDGVYEFESLPPAWRATGDWQWFTRASGDLSKPTRLPSAVQTQDGTIQSGVFGGKPVGSNGTALRTAEWIPLNSSGIAEVDITVASGEVTDIGTSGRTVKFDLRYHLMGQGVTVPPDEDDDSIKFYVSPRGAPASSNRGEVAGLFKQGPCYASTCDYFTVQTHIPPGEYTLRWVFRRGTTPNTLPYTGDESVAYVDNVLGLDAPTEPSIFGYVKVNATATGVIHGFLSKIKHSHIHGYMNAFYHWIPRWGYLQGGPNASSEINAFAAGMNQGQIDGYMLGGIDLKSIPTGTIDVYMPVQSGTMKAINAYLLGMKQGEIHGYMVGLSGITPASGIHGYMKVIDAFGSIHGGVNLGASGVTSSIYGFLANRVNETINGYVLGPSGALSTIYSYMSPQNIGTINGYIASLSSITGNIQGYVLAPDAAGEIYGYLPASGDPLVGSQQRINGYLFNAGATERIFGYLNVLDSDEINGYIKGHSVASGTINAFASGVGFATMEALGYLAGISGTASGTINSYLVSAGQANSSIYGWIIGIPIAANSKEACGNHGTVPLPPNTPPTIPPNCFNV